MSFYISCNLTNIQNLSDALFSVCNTLVVSFMIDKIPIFLLSDGFEKYYPIFNKNKFTIANNFNKIFNKNTINIKELNDSKINEMRNLNSNIILDIPSYNFSYLLNYKNILIKQLSLDPENYMISFENEKNLICIYSEDEKYIDSTKLSNKKNNNYIIIGPNSLSLNITDFDFIFIPQKNEIELLNIMLMCDEYINFSHNPLSNWASFLSTNNKTITNLF